MNNFLNNISSLFVHLFEIWEYPTFSVLIVVICCYLAVKLVQGMVRK